MNYNFKQIKPISAAKDLINIVLSKTQRKTPTVVHANFEITRIRSFYMRKIKFTQSSLHEKLSFILDDFPKLDDIHPFFADLINVLYDRDHYKLALGHIHSARNLVDNVAKDYVRLMKYADSLYRCKMLKKAALGRMATITKKLTSSLAFLEEVRKHLARLPSINPFERTLLITGYPNVGKSSFINQITNANVEVQPYPFTTQSLYVGHTDYNYVRWQVIDSPGILDHPLEQRNTIEMQSITALAHLKACILFFIDISETCGYTIDQQVNLFLNIKPLFANKPVVLVFTKIDLKTMDALDACDRERLFTLAQQEGITTVEMSNKSGEGINIVKSKACDTLLAHRMNQNSDSLAAGSTYLKKEEDFLRGLHVIHPKKRDNKERPAMIPKAILEKQPLSLGRPTLKEIQEQHGGAGVFNFPLQEHYILEDPDWKYDIVPEIIDGKNIADYVDKDILERLEELEREEEMLDEARGNMIEEEEEELDASMIDAFKEVKGKKAVLKIQHRLKKSQRAYPRNKDFNDVKEKLNAKGHATNKLEERVVLKRRNMRLNQLRNKANKEMNEENNADRMEDEGETEQREITQRLGDRKRSISRSKSKGIPVVKTEMVKAGIRMKVKIEKQFRHIGQRGETDKRIPTYMPRHLFSGKRGIGKNDRR